MSEELDKWLADPNNKVYEWMGKRLDQYSKEELIGIIITLAEFSDDLAERSLMGKNYVPKIMGRRWLWEI